jgi:uncharacterized membrane protein (Fun14 family)
MVIPVLGTGMETLLFSLGGGSLLGYLAARALRVIVKIAAIIIGVFILGLAFLSYKGWITANWPVMQDQAQRFAYNASAQVLHMINDTASKFHPSMVSAEGTPIAAGVGFMSGFFLGIRH